MILARSAFEHPLARRTRRARQRRGAFTLVEILLAMAILAGVLAAIYSSWMAVLQATRTSQRAAADRQRSRLAVRCLEEALVSAQMFPANAQHYAFLADTSEENAALSFVARLPEAYPRSGRFQGKSMRRVEFVVEPDETGTPTLLLRQVPFLLEEDPMEMQQPLRLARNVRLFYLEFWGPDSVEWEEEWLYTNQLPRMVRFSLATAPEGERTVNRQDVISRVAMLPLANASAVTAGLAPPPGVRPRPGGGDPEEVAPQPEVLQPARRLPGRRR